MTKEKLEALLEQEYFHLQRQVEDFDKRMLTIKAWSITFSFAAIGAAYSVQQPLVLLVASGSAFVFWMIEILWKTFQYAHYKRIHQIEDYYKGAETEINPLQIGKTWSKSFRTRRLKNFLRILFWPHVYLPHIIVVIAGLILYYLETASSNG